MVERVLVQQVRLVEQKGRVHRVPTDVLHMRADRIEQRCGGGRRCQAERMTQLPIEVAASQRGIMAAGQPAPLRGNTGTHRAQDTRLADPRLTREQHRVMVGDRLAEVIDEGLLAVGDGADDLAASRLWWNATSSE